MKINKVEEMVMSIDLLLTMLRTTAVATQTMLTVVFGVKNNSLMILNQFGKVLLSE